MVEVAPIANFDEQNYLPKNGKYKILSDNVDEYLSDKDFPIRLRRLPDGEELFLVFSTTSPILDVAWDGGWLGLIQNGSVFQLIEENGRTRKTFPTFGSNIVDVACSPNGHVIAYNDLVSGTYGVVNYPIILANAGRTDLVVENDKIKIFFAPLWNSCSLLVNGAGFLTKTRYNNTCEMNPFDQTNYVYDNNTILFHRASLLFLTFFSNGKVTFRDYHDTEVKQSKKITHYGIMTMSDKWLVCSADYDTFVYSMDDILADPQFDKMVYVSPEFAGNQILTDYLKENEMVIVNEDMELPYKIDIIEVLRIMLLYLPLTEFEHVLALRGYIPESALEVFHADEIIYDQRRSDKERVVYCLDDAADETFLKRLYPKGLIIFDVKMGVFEYSS